MFADEAPGDGISELIIEGKVIDCGEIGISRSTPDKARGKPRFLIYLPTTRNYLWEVLWKKRVKVRVFMEIEDTRGHRTD